MTDKTVVYEVSNGVARIILNRPKVNALNLQMIKEVVEAFEIAGKDDGIRAIVLTSAVSKAFSAGLDLNILLGKSEEKVRGLLQELYVRLYDTQYNLGKPSIAAVGGAARGGEMTMAISCDVILAGQSATFGYPEIDAGVIPAIHSVTFLALSVATVLLSCCFLGGASAPKKRIVSALSVGSCPTRNWFPARKPWQKHLLQNQLS